jgi:hypothetical protein
MSYSLTEWLAQENEPLLKIASLDLQYRNNSFFFLLPIFTGTVILNISDFFRAHSNKISDIKQPSPTTAMAIFILHLNVLYYRSPLLPDSLLTHSIQVRAPMNITFILSFSPCYNIISYFFFPKPLLNFIKQLREFP